MFETRNIQNLSLECSWPNVECSVETTSHPLCPLGRHFCQRGQAGPYILTALRIVGGRAQHRLWPVPLHVLTPAMELIHRHTKPSGIAPTSLSAINR